MGEFGVLLLLRRESEGFSCRDVSQESGDSLDLS